MGNRTFHRWSFSEHLFSAKKVSSFKTTFSILVFKGCLLFCNKKVLLREGKRHTDRRVASRRGGADRQTDTCENITFPHPSDAVGKYVFHLGF